MDLSERLRRRIANLEQSLTSQEAWRTDLRARLEAADLKIATRRKELREYRALLAEIEPGASTSP